MYVEYLAHGNCSLYVNPFCLLLFTRVSRRAHTDERNRTHALETWEKALLTTNRLFCFLALTFEPFVIYCFSPNGQGNLRPSLPILSLLRHLALWRYPLIFWVIWSRFLRG